MGEGNKAPPVVSLTIEKLRFAAVQGPPLPDSCKITENPCAVDGVTVALPGGLTDIEHVRLKANPCGAQTSSNKKTLSKKRFICRGLRWKPIFRMRELDRFMGVLSRAFFIRQIYTS